MKLSVLAAKAAKLPERPSFEWPGPEMYHDAVFKEHMQTTAGCIEYIDHLRQRMNEYSFALDALCDAYDRLREVILEAEVDES